MEKRRRLGGSLRSEEALHPRIGAVVAALGVLVVAHAIPIEVATPMGPEGSMGPPKGSRLEAPAVLSNLMP